jgi:hypothetical protein
VPEKPYNPLDRRNLARSVEVTLLQRPALPLPLASPFDGAGLYAIYYAGRFPAYRQISSPHCMIPIYVGKADPAGARRGLVDAADKVGPVLWKRIDDHSKSIAAADNLVIGDFRVRYLVVEDIFIGMGEQLLIQQFRPLWNVHVSGFGLHDPGSRRHGGNRSEWDELHPGRSWQPHMRQVTTPEQITAKVLAAFKSGQAATTGGMATTSPPVATLEASVPEAPEVDHE